MIKPDCYTNMGKIIQLIEQNGFLISNLKMIKLSLRDAQEFYAEHQVLNNYSHHI
jgi:nucleoside-diphosphate kinase